MATASTMPSDEDAPSRAAEAAEAPAAEPQPPRPAGTGSRPAAEPAKRSRRRARRPLAAVAPRRPRVIVANRADGGFFYWLGKLYGFAALGLAVAVVLSVVLFYRYVAGQTPAAPDFSSYSRVSPAVSRMYAADGTLLGEFAREWRTVTPYDQMPDHLVHAFLAVEDHQFFDHGGIYLKGIARAAWANVTVGDFAQGGSTITQQVAKQFLGTEKSLERKAREAVMARRIESRYSKRAILSVYLNHIYLGAGAYGVAAAAQRYFQKDLSELTLAEAALIAGLAQAPSRYSPLRSPERAVERRNVVLDQMEKYGFVTPDEAAAARTEALHLEVYRDVFPDRMPYYSEHVRRQVSDHPELKARFGDDPLMTAGLRIETAAEPAFEAAAYENVDYMAHKQDKRQGWRGPEWYLGDEAQRDLFVQRQRAIYGEGDGPLRPGKRYLAVVEDVGSSGAKVRVGDRVLDLPMKNMSWAAPWRSGFEVSNDAKATSAKKVLRPGDVVWVKREIRTRAKFREWELGEGLNPRWLGPDDKRAWDEGNPHVVQLEQTPHPQVVIFNGDHRTGYVPAMVGGNDYSRSVFNRAVQACRTPASAFKPIYYSLALEEGFGYDTVLPDERITIKDPVTGAEWTPKNLYDDLDGDVSLEYALVFSKNIPSIYLFKQLGKHNVAAWARKLGFTNGDGIPDFNVDDSMALGSSCTRLSDLTRAFAIFARGGRWLEWSYIRRILDREGNVVLDNTVAFDPMLPPGARLDRVAAVAGDAPEQVMKPRTAYLTTKLLNKMVEHGLTKTVRNTELSAGGKTGTSDFTFDTQFVAFTSRLITLVWAGDDDRVRTLGRDDAAYITIVPLWARYMWQVARQFPNQAVPWEVPPGVSSDDRGDHAKGRRGARMTLRRHYAKDVLRAEGLLPEDGGGQEGP
jgi:penicillin-binding protein 1A